MEPWAVALLGLAAGALVGLTGSSGVAVVVPALTYMGFSFQKAVAASLVVDVLATSLAVIVYLRAGYVDVGTAAVMGAAAVAGALLGSHIAVRSPEAPLELAFAASSAYFAYTSIVNAKRGSDVGLMPLVRSMMRRLPHSRALALAASGGIGILTGLLGTSGGLMFTALLTATTDMPIKKAIGTATMAMFISALGGALAYTYLGYASSIAALIGLVALISGYLFARLARRLSPRAIYAALAALFISIAIASALKAIT